jgi:glycosyltransferase involved in cell wall biosynthesis
MNRQMFTGRRSYKAGGTMRVTEELGESGPELSVVVPCFNEEAVLRETNLRLLAVLEEVSPSFEIIYVDDGSTDSSSEVFRELQFKDERIRVIRLSRNFGHQIAITAGLEHARGNAVVVIDADLQDPPEVIRNFFSRWLEGYDVVYGVRAHRDGETPFKLWTAKFFYRLINRLSDTAVPLDAGDFRLIDRSVVDALLSMPECDRFIRGMVSWLGFSQIGVNYERAERFAGSTKFSLFKMLRFAMDGIVSFSILPLRIATWIGFAASGVALVEIALALFNRIFTPGLVRGWTSTVIAIWFVGGVQLICLGIIGEYVGRIYGESKRRPLYVVQEKMGFEITGAAMELRPRVRTAVVGR